MSEPSEPATLTVTAVSLLPWWTNRDENGFLHMQGWYEFPEDFGITGWTASQRFSYGGQVEPAQVHLTFRDHVRAVEFCLKYVGE